MLILDIGETEAFDEEKNEFVTVGGTRVELEHSLVSLAKWESIYEKPFLSPDTKTTNDETVAYIGLMMLDPNFDTALLKQLTNKNIEAVNEYLVSKQTATWFATTPGATVRSRETITAEVIYYWMVALNIPFDPCQNWHLNRLLTLVKVCNEKNQPNKPKKRFTRSDLAARGNLNAQRKAQNGTAG